jgi:aldehyde:ferredoxin oxidoreductase
MYGWTGNILHIDLTRQTTSVEHPPQEVYEKYIGGKGLAGFYLAERVTEPWDAPSMPLLFFTGPLVDTPSPTSGRMTIMSRSPYTGTIGDASVGGKLGTQIKRAGWDGIVITGKSKTPCGLVLSDSDVTFADARSMEGMETGQVFAALGKDGAIATIGPAAENGVLFANIIVDTRYFAGRSGLGLVMAAKNLKYLHVKGSGKTAIHDKEELMKAREEIFRLAAASPILKGEFGISNFGTGALYDLMHNRRMMPTRNFRETRFAHAGEMNSWHYRERYGYKKTGCKGCHILCKKNSRKNLELPEFETMSHFSALIDNRDLDTVVEANRVCNETGMDTISAAATLACYAEIEGKTLSPTEIIDLLQDMAASRGEGGELKLGSFRYAEHRGRPECAMTVKASELPAYDPRGVYGMALAYATSTRGGCHLRAYPISYEILRKPVAMDRFETSGKARIIKISEDQNAVIDSLTACKFLFFAASLEEYAKAFTGITGLTTSAQDLLKIGERIYYHERLMNARNGFKGKDDDLPRRFFTEPGTGGEGISIPPIGREDFLKARADYYKIRGLDSEGLPTKDKCEALGIEWKDW